MFKLLLIATTTFAFVLCHHDPKHTELTKKMQDEGIIPDVIDKVPPLELSVTFANDKKVQLGNELTPTEVKEVPTIQWEAEKDTFYTLAMVDPDAPSRKEPKWREVKHWLVGNIPGAKLAEGETIAAFMSSGPPKGTGLHRYIFLLFKQAKKLSFNEPKTGAWSREHRLSFNIRKFAEKYELVPVAGNFYKAQWDAYVEERNKKITT